MPAIIELDTVSFAYGSEQILDDISLSVESGDYLGIIGPNGGGKTTLLKLILGLLNPQHGQVKLWGTPLEAFTDWYKIGYVPQRSGNSDYRLPITVEEVVSFGTIARKRDKQNTATPWAMEQVGITSLANRPLTSLSGGQQQKVFIAKALASKPDVLVLDEPTVGVDVQAQDEFYQLLEQLNKKHNLTLIMVSHDIDVVVNEVNKLACINERLVYHGEPKEFMQGDYLTKLYGKTRKFILHGH